MLTISTATAQIFAQVDVHIIYVSCERAFNPPAGRPVVVLSNNDGCRVAVSAEIKTPAVTMGAPWHHMQGLVREHGIIGLSSK